MHQRYFPRCPVNGPILPAVPFNHLGLEGSVPSKCSSCAHLFEGECLRFVEQKGYMALDHGACEIDGPTDPVTVDNKWISSKVEVPRKCSTCSHLEYDALRGFTCGAQTDLWGWFRRGLDWGTWSPERLHVNLPPYRATREMIDAASEGRLKEFVEEFRSLNPNESLLVAQKAYCDARQKLAFLEPTRG